MDCLPDELIIHILSFLDTVTVVRVQRLASRYLHLARDDALWKNECFNHSYAEDLRRRQHCRSRRDAPFAGAFQQTGSSQLDVLSDPSLEARRQRSRARANWEPGYPLERLNYYGEYIHRYAPVNVGWIDLPRPSNSHWEGVREATGIALLRDHQDSADQRAIAPLDDGRICIWDVSVPSTTRSGGAARLLAQTKSGLLTGRPEDATAESHMLMTETGVIECVSVDNYAQKAYFAVQSLLQEVDLSTLQISSIRQYPFPITALSESDSREPLTVGTNMTVHLHDPRDPAFVPQEGSSVGERMGGSVYSHATLAQPGPLSILHHNAFGESDSSIWVAGRFTSLLNYDRRFFPRLRGTLFSGARIASLAAIPYPFLPQNLDLLRNPDATICGRREAKDTGGASILAAAEYKGKGSLEIYSLPGQKSFHNRQTASATKLFSVAPHGGRIVFSDGNGELKWVERDGFTHVRTVNINDLLPHEATSASGLWPSMTSETLGQGDIVQKILPFHHPTDQSPLSASGPASSSDRIDIHGNNLLLWTGDGRLGVLGFGPTNPLHTSPNDSWFDALEDQVFSAEQRALAKAEKLYALAMRKALERNADEVRFVQGLGMGFVR